MPEWVCNVYQGGCAFVKAKLTAPRLGGAAGDPLDTLARGGYRGPLTDPPRRKSTADNRSLCQGG